MVCSSDDEYACDRCLGIYVGGGYELPAGTDIRRRCSQNVFEDCCDGKYPPSGVAENGELLLYPALVGDCPGPQCAPALVDGGDKGSLLASSDILALAVPSSEMTRGGGLRRMSWPA